MTHSLRLSGAVHVAPLDALFDDVATEVVSMALTAVGDRGGLHLALPGGSTPGPFYQRRVIDPRWRAMPWERTHLWIVDERRVPEDDERCNYRMIRETLIEHVPLRMRQCHPMPALAEDAAARYEQDLRRFVEPNSPIPPLDFVLLGMGEDAHTASLFPNSAALLEAEALVAINAGANVTPPDRVTMTYRLLNAARRVAVLVAGRKKAAALRRVDEQLRTGRPDIANLPITGIAPLALAKDPRALIWFLDTEAAGT